MKKWLSLISILLMLTVAVFAFASCNSIEDFIPNGENEGDKPNEPDTPVIPDKPVEPTVKKVTIHFFNKDKNEEFGTLEIDAGRALSDDEKKQIQDLRYNGYGFADWYTDIQCKEKFDFATVVEKDITLYGDRGNLAGENIVWSTETKTVNDVEVITLLLKGNGPMFDFKYLSDVPWNMYVNLISDVKFEGAITTIGKSSFAKFSQIKEVVLPDTIEVIGKEAFLESSISKINFPNSLLNIQTNAFFRCKNLTRLEFNKGLKNIEKSAFYECTGVTDVVLTDKIAELGGSAFYGAKNIMSVFYVGTKEQYDNLIVRLDNFWISDLANTYFMSENKPDVPGPYWHFGDKGEIVQWYYTVGFLANRKQIIPFEWDYIDPVEGVKKENIDKLNSLSYHGYKFARWDGRAYGVDYKEGLVLKGDIRLVGDRGNLCGDNVRWRMSGSVLTLSGSGRMWDFETLNDTPWCKKVITKVIIGKDIEYIGQFAFSMNTSLVEITLHSNIKEVNVRAFTGCNELKYIYFDGDANMMNAVRGLSNLDKDMILDAKVYCKKTPGSPDVGLYWEKRKDDLAERYVAYEFRVDGTLVIGGHYSLINYQKVEDTPWFHLGDKVVRVEFIKGADRIGAHTIDGFAKVESIIIPDTVLKIAGSAFINTGYYNNPANWENGALYISKHLIKVNPKEVSELFVMRSNTLSIAENAFEGCSNIKYVVFGKDIKGVYRNALLGLTSLERFYFEGISQEAWNSIWSPNGNNHSAGQTIPKTVEVYCYSKLKPRNPGNYWHFDKVDGIETVVIWENN